PDVLGQPHRVSGGLDMHGDIVHASLGVAGRPAVRLLDHQVAVQRNAGDPPQALHHRQPDGQVGHEMGVHDVHVQPVGAGPRLDLGSQAGKVSRQDAWRDHRRVSHANESRALVVTCRSMWEGRLLAYAGWKSTERCEAKSVWCYEPGKHWEMLEVTGP